MARVNIDSQKVVGHFTTKLESLALRIAEEILLESKPEVPVDTGDLQLSGSLEETPKGFRVRYSATNGDYNYAIRQHEDTTLNHPNGGKSHYLLHPALRVIGRYPKA